MLSPQAHQYVILLVNFVSRLCMCIFEMVTYNLHDIKLLEKYHLVPITNLKILLPHAYAHYFHGAALPHANNIRHFLFFEWFIVIIIRF